MYKTKWKEGTFCSIGYVCGTSVNWNDENEKAFNEK
jgi:hypothetical protein